MRAPWSATRPERHRLLYVAPAELFGGAERQAVFHIAKLGAHGFDVVPVVGPGRLIIDALADAGVREYVYTPYLCHELHHPTGAWGTMAFGARFLRDWIETQRLLARITAEKPVDLIIAIRPPGWIAASAMAHYLGVPMVWRAGGRLTSAEQTLALHALARALPPDLLVANCEAVRADLAPVVGSPSTLLANAVDIERFAPRRAIPRFRIEHGIPDHEPVVGFVARPAPEKGMELLAGVVAETVRAMPSVRFLAAGEFGWREHFEEMFAERGLGAHIRFVGHVRDVENFLASCDVVVLTSKAHSIEGSSNALLEAMAMERPIVATRVGGIDETVHDGIEGFLTPEDAGTFSARVVSLLRDRELRRRMGEAGRAAILERHRPDKVIARLADVLHAVRRHAAVPAVVAPAAAGEPWSWGGAAWPMRPVLARGRG